MKSLLHISACVLLTACGSGSEPAPNSNNGSPPTVNSDQITVGGMTRSFRLFVPSNPPNGPMPLVVAMHGGGGRNGIYPQEDAWRTLAEREGFVFVYPLSEVQAGNEGEWILNTEAIARHDLDFIEALIDGLSAQHNLDANRIYATGYSLGAMFTYEFACHLSERFAAIVAHAGTMPVQPQTCAPSQAMGLMHLHGTEDTIIPYNTTWDWKEWDAVGTMMDIPQLIQFWRNQFNCSETQQLASTSSRHEVHSQCDGDVRVEHHALNGVGHDWPERINGTSTHEVAWSFLSEFSKP